MGSHYDKQMEEWDDKHYPNKSYMEIKQEMIRGQEVMEIRDIEGIIRTIPMTNVIASNFKLLGMDLSTIAELRHVYVRKGGNMPMTKATVAEVFNEVEAK